MTNQSLARWLLSMRCRESFPPRFRSTRLALFWLVAASVLLLFQSNTLAQFAPASSIAPALKVARSNENMIVSWLISPFDFVLESTNSLSASGGWLGVSAPQSFVEDEASVTLPMTNAQEFFRLVKTGLETGSASLPLFQFQIFYAVDLEIASGPVMTINGPVHGNQNVYLQPQSTLTFRSHLTAAGNIVNDKKPGDPTVRVPGTVVYVGGHRAGVNPLALPVGTNVLREILNIPPVGEEVTSLMGQQRFYNKADMIIKIASGGQITVTSGRVNNFATTIPRQQWDILSNANNGSRGFITTNVSFFNKRENKTVTPIQIDIGKLSIWNSQATNLLRPLLTNTAGNITIIYVVDERSHSVVTEPGVRLVNGQTLLPKGLTVATPNPAYIWGHYNVTNSALGTTNTSQTKPAAIIGDAITILSPNWSDTFSSLALGSRSAISTTVNAAFLAGIVETTTNSFSGGIDNFPRFLENWSGDTFTYSGSMVAMYESVYAIGQWLGTGTTIGIYNPPIRTWTFDQNFRDPTKLPPGTPLVGVIEPTN